MNSVLRTSAAIVRHARAQLRLAMAWGAAACEDERLTAARDEGAAEMRERAARKLRDIGAYAWCTDAIAALPLRGPA